MVYRDEELEYILSHCVGATGLYDKGQIRLLNFIQTVYPDVICFATEKSLRSHNEKQTSVDKGLRETWEPSIHLDGRPVDRFVVSSNKPTRSHRFTKVGKESRSHLLEDVGKAETERKIKREGERKTRM